MVIGIIEISPLKQLYVILENATTVSLNFYLYISFLVYFLDCFGLKDIMWVFFLIGAVQPPHSSEFRAWLYSGCRKK